MCAQPTVAIWVGVRTTKISLEPTAGIRWVALGIQTHAGQLPPVTLLAIIRLDNAITTVGAQRTSRRTSAVRGVIVRSHATPWNWNRSITAVALFSRFDNAVATVAYRSSITTIGATRYAQLSWN